MRRLLLPILMFCIIATSLLAIPQASSWSGDSFNLARLRSIMSKQGFSQQGSRWVLANHLVSGAIFIKREGIYVEQITVRVVYNKVHRIGPLYTVSYMAGQSFSFEQEDGSVIVDDVFRPTLYDYSWKSLRQLDRGLKKFLEMNRRIIKIEMLDLDGLKALA